MFVYFLSAVEGDVLCGVIHGIARTVEYARVYLQVLYLQIAGYLRLYLHRGLLSAYHGSGDVEWMACEILLRVGDNKIDVAE